VGELTVKTEYYLKKELKIIRDNKSVAALLFADHDFSCWVVLTGFRGQLNIAKGQTS